MNFKIFFLCLIINNSLCLNAGLKSLVTQKGLDYVKQIGSEILMQRIKTVKLPNISGEAGTPVGTISYQLTNLVLTGLAIPTTSINLESGKVKIAASGITCHVSMDWHYRENHWPHVSDGGSASISVSAVSISSTISLTESNYINYIKLNLKKKKKKILKKFKFLFFLINHIN